MLGRRFGLGLALVFVLGGGLAPVVARAGEEATEKTFLAGLEKVRAQLKSGKSADGLKATLLLLKQHENQDYARAKRVELEDLVKRLSFGVKCPQPAAKDIIKGNLVSYFPSSGRIKLVCEPRRSDFETHDSLEVFPARFVGPYIVEIKGHHYPGDLSDVPIAIVGMEEDKKTQRRNSWRIVFGGESGRSWIPPKLVHLDGETEKVLFEREAILVGPGRSYTLKVDVGSSRIAAHANLQVLGQCVKPSNLFGRFAFRCRGWDFVTVEGPVEPSWVQGRIDALVQENLKEFEQGFEVRTVLPDWLYEAAATTAPAPSRDDDNPWPVDIPSTHWARVTEFVKHLGDEHFAEALAVVEALGTAGAPEVLCRYLAGQARFQQGDWAAALADLDRTAALAPGFAAGQLLRGQILSRLGRAADAEAALRAALQARPADVQMVESAAVALLVAGRGEAAGVVLEDAVRRGLRDPTLDAIAQVLVKVNRGPDWTKSYEFKSSNFHVLSDIDTETSKQAALVLEEGLAAFKFNFQGLAPESPRQYKVFLFGGRGGFAKYMEDVGVYSKRSAGQAAGVYHPMLKQLLIWNLPTREEMMQTVRHEGFHQYLDRLLPDAPTWFNEGLAVYYESMGTVPGQPKYGAVQQEHLRELEEKHILPLTEFIFQSHKEFYVHGHRAYAQAWLLVHMLRHGEAAHKQLFKDLLTRLKTQPPFEALRAVFPPEVVAKLDSQLRAYAGTLARPR